MIKNYSLIIIFLFIINIPLIFSRTLDEIIESGVLNVGMTKNPVEYIINEKGEYEGFNYDLIKAFADYINVELNIIEIKTISSIFSKNGTVPKNVKTDESIRYTPDIFRDKTIDICAGALTKLPWREKLFDFITIIKNKQIMYTRNPILITDLNIDMEKKKSDISNINFLIRKNTSYHYVFDKKIKNKVEGANIVYTDLIDDECILKILNGKYDFGIIDAVAFLLQNLKHGRKLVFRLGITDEEEIGWIIRKNNDDLRNKLKEFVELKTTNKLLHDSFNKYFGVPYNTYLNMILTPLKDKSEYIDHKMLIKFME